MFTVPSLLRRHSPLDEAPARAALEAKALLVTIDEDFPLAAEGTAEVLLAPIRDGVEHFLPDHRCFLVHPTSPLQPDREAEKV